MNQQLDPETGRLALQSFLEHKSPLGPLRVLFERVGGFFQIPLPGFKPYVVAGPEANRKVLVTKQDKVLWRNHDPVTDLLRRGVLVTDGEEHDQYRKLMEPSLHPSQLNGYTQMILTQTERVTATWRDSQSVDMLVESRKIALLIIMQALFSVNAWDDLSLIWRPILKAIQYISPGAWILWRKIPRPGYKKHLRVLDKYLYKIITERRQMVDDRPQTIDHDPSSTVHCPSSDLLQHLIDAGLDDHTIRDQMLTMLIAGHDTSTALLRGCLPCLASTPTSTRNWWANLNMTTGHLCLTRLSKKRCGCIHPSILGTVW